MTVQKLLRYLFAFTILLYIASILFPKTHLEYPLSILCLILVVSNMFWVKRFVKVLAILFLFFGCIMLWKSDAEWQDYIKSFGPMLDLITMMTLLPILGLTVNLGEYNKDIQTLIQKKVKTFSHLYMVISGISYSLAVFMNLATLPMIYHSVRPSLSNFSTINPERFMSTAIIRGYAMSLMWAPMTPIVGVVIEVTGVNWLSVLQYILPLSLLGILLDWHIVRRRYKECRLSEVTKNETATSIEKEISASAKRVIHIVWAILCFNILISIAEYKLPFSFLVIVSLLVIPFSFTWSVFLGKTKGFVEGLFKYFSSFSMMMKDQFCIYLSAGFLISAVRMSHTNDLLYSWINQIKSVIGVNFFLILLPLIPLTFSFLGLHPAVTIVLMAEALDPELLGISPSILTVAMLAGAVSAFLVGPYNATIGLMSSIIKKNSFKVSRWNVPYTALYLGVVMLYLAILELL